MKKVSRLLGPVLGLLLTIWLLSKVNFAQLGSICYQINYPLLLLSILIGQISFAMRALRWRYLLLETQPIRLRKLYSALSVGMAANWILPFRIGEMAGAYSLSRMETTPFTTLMASVVADRILDICWLAGALIFVLITFPLKTVIIPESIFGVRAEIARSSLVQSAQVLSGLLVAGSVFLILLYYRQAQLLRLIHLVFRPISLRLALAIERLCLSFADGLHVLRNGWHLVMSIVTTLLVWGIGLAGVYVLVASFPFDVQPDFKMCLLVLVSLAAGLTIPNAPGYIGTFHIAIVLGLLMARPGMDVNLAVSFAIVYHLIQFVPAMLLGLYFMWADNLSLIPEGTMTEKFSRRRS